MPKRHTFDDGTVVELDDDVEVSDFLDADAEAGINGEEYAALIAAAEAEEEELDDDGQPDGIEAGV